MKPARILTWLLTLAALGCQSQPVAPSVPAPAASAPAGLPAAPPWPAPTDPAARIQAAGIEALKAEAFTVHLHAHLSVFYNGAPVTVPANVGIGSGFISPLHTHADAGVLHVESATVQPFTVGQFFTEWGVPLSGARAYVNGAEVPDAGAIVLEDRQIIAVVFGTPPATIPTTYTGRWL